MATGAALPATACARVVRSPVLLLLVPDTDMVSHVLQDLVEPALNALLAAGSLTVPPPSPQHAATARTDLNMEGGEIHRRKEAGEEAGAEVGAAVRALAAVTVILDSASGKVGEGAFYTGCWTILMAGGDMPCWATSWCTCTAGPP